MLNKEFTRGELIYEIEKRACGQTSLVILTESQWRTIEQAYNSPLLNIIDQTTLKVTPQREVGSKKLTFQVFARN